jgi:hypothetical protein
MNFVISIHAFSAAIPGLIYPKLFIDLMFVDPTQCKSETCVFIFQAFLLLVFAFSCAYLYAAIHPLDKGIYFTGFVGKTLIFMFFTYAYHLNIVTTLAFVLGVSDLIFAIVYFKKYLKITTTRTKTFTRTNTNLDPQKIDNPKEDLFPKYL